MYVFPSRAGLAIGSHTRVARQRWAAGIVAHQGRSGRPQRHWCTSCTPEVRVERTALGQRSCGTARLSQAGSASRFKAPASSRLPLPDRPAARDRLQHLSRSLRTRWRRPTGRTRNATPRCQLFARERSHLLGISHRRDSPVTGSRPATWRTPSEFVRVHAARAGGLTRITERAPEPMKPFPVPSSFRPYASPCPMAQNAILLAHASITCKGGREEYVWYEAAEFRVALQHVARSSSCSSPDRLHGAWYLQSSHWGLRQGRSFFNRMLIVLRILTEPAQSMAKPACAARIDVADVHSKIRACPSQLACLAQAHWRHSDCGRALLKDVPASRRRTPLRDMEAESLARHKPVSMQRPHGARPTSTCAPRSGTTASAQAAPSRVPAGRELMRCVRESAGMSMGSLAGTPQAQAEAAVRS